MTNNEPNTRSARRAPSVAIAFRTLGRTLRHGYENMGTLAIISVLWYASALVIVPLGTTTAALHRVTRPMSEARAANWRNFWTHLRSDLGWGSKLLIVLVLGFATVLINIRFYNSAPAEPLRWLAVIFSAVFLIWTGIALYAFPLALRQEDQRIWRTIRNAGVMTLANLPGAIISLVLLLLLCGVLLIIPPLFLLVPGVVALWAEENARLLLVAGGYVPEDPFADAPRRRG